MGAFVDIQETTGSLADNWDQLAYRGQPVSDLLFVGDPSPVVLASRAVDDLWQGDEMNPVRITLAGLAYDPDEDCFFLGYDVLPEGDHFTFTKVIWSATKGVLSTAAGNWGQSWHPHGFRQALKQHPNLSHLRYF